MPKTVLVPYDGSPQSTKAVEFVVSEWPDAEITLLHVINPVEAGYSATGGIPSGAEEWFESAKARSQGLLSDAREEFGEGVRMTTRTEVGRPANAIVELAGDDDEEFDHVALGSHGRSGLSRIVLGSVAESVVRNSPVPVTVVR